MALSDHVSMGEPRQAGKRLHLVKERSFKFQGRIEGGGGGGGAKGEALL